MIEQSDAVDFAGLADQSWRMVRDALRDFYLARGVDAAILDQSLDVVGAIYIRHRDTPPQTDSDPAKAAEQMYAFGQHPVNWHQWCYERQRLVSSRMY